MSEELERSPVNDRRTFLESLERLALGTGLVAALVQAGITFLFNPGAEGLPLIGSPDSMAIRSLFSTIVIALIMGPYAYIRGMQARNRVIPEEFRQDYRLSVVPATLAAAILFGITIGWSFAVLERAFPGVVFNRITMTLFLSTVAGIVGYMVVTTMGQLRAPGMLYLGVGALFGTLIFAGARHEDPYWWEYSFSHLGMTPSNSKSIFNIGLVFTGVLLVIWQQFFMTDLKVLERRGLITHRTLRIFNVSLVLVGVLLAFVGIVRFGIGPFFNVVHNVSATGMGVILGLLMLAMWKLNPHYVRVFYYVSILIVAAMIGVVLAMVFGFIGLTGLEFVCFTLASLWLILFFRNTELLIEEIAPESRM